MAGRHSRVFLEAFKKICIARVAQSRLHLCDCLAVPEQVLRRCNFLQCDIVTDGCMCMLFKQARKIVGMQEEMPGKFLHSQILCDVIVYISDDFVNSLLGRRDGRGKHLGGAEIFNDFIQSCEQGKELCQCTGRGDLGEREQCCHSLDQFSFGVLLRSK